MRKNPLVNLQKAIVFGGMISVVVISVCGLIYVAGSLGISMPAGGFGDGAWKDFLGGGTGLIDPSISVSDQSIGTPDPTPRPNPDPDTKPKPIDPNLSWQEIAGITATSGISVGDNDINFLNISDNHVDLSEIARIPLDIDVENQDGPTVLIMHTHGTEAYTWGGGDSYVESEPWRTTDSSQNMLRVGAEVAETIRDYGIEVIHDTTLYDYPDYLSSYENARAGVESYLAEYPSIQFVIDIHRDGVLDYNGRPFKLLADGYDTPTAQVMLVCGSENIGGGDTVVDPEAPPERDANDGHAYWRNNLALGIRLQLQMTEEKYDFARNLSLRGHTYNQELSTGSLLIEVGSHGNTLQEALRAATELGNDIGEMLVSLPDEAN